MTGLGSPAHARIYRRRVYVAGFSSSGSIAYRFGQEIPGHIAAASSVAERVGEVMARGPIHEGRSTNAAAAAPKP